MASQARPQISQGAGFDCRGKASGKRKEKSGTPHQRQPNAS